MTRVVAHIPVFVVSTVLVVLSACGGAAPATPVPSAAAPASAAVPGKPAASAGVAAKPASSAPAVAMTYGVLPSVGSTPVYVPIENGTFASQGLDISVQPFTDTVQIMVSVGSGQLQLGGITLGAAAFNALNRGVVLKGLASLNQDPPGHGTLAPMVVRADLWDSGVLRTPAQLKGRKLAVNAKGVILEYTMAKILAKGGLKPSDVELTYMPFPDMVTALGNKSIDGGMMVEPSATQAITKGVGKLFSDDHASGTQYVVIVTNAKFAESHRDAIERFLQTYIEYVRKFSDGGLKKDNQALGFVEKYTKVTPDITKQVPDPYWHKDGRVNLASLEDQQSYYLSVKSVDYSQPIGLASFMDESYLANALKRLGG